MSPAEAMLRGISLQPITDALGVESEESRPPARAQEPDDGVARLLVYVPREMRRRIKLRCAMEDESVSAFARRAFEAALAEDD